MVGPYGRRRGYGRGYPCYWPYGLAWPGPSTSFDSAVLRSVPLRSGRSGLSRPCLRYKDERVGRGLRLGEPGTREGRGEACWRGSLRLRFSSLRANGRGGVCSGCGGVAPNHFEAVAKVQSVRGVHVSLSGLVPCCVIPGCVIPEGPVLPAPTPATVPWKWPRGRQALLLPYPEEILSVSLLA